MPTCSLLCHIIFLIGLLVVFSGGQLTAGISSVAHSGFWRLEAAQPHSQPHSPLAGPCRSHPASASSSSSTASQSDIVQSSSSSIFARPRSVWRLDGSFFSPNRGAQWALLTPADWSLTVGLENKSRQRLQIPGVRKLQYPPRFGCCSLSALSGGHGTLQPHDPCLSLSLSLSLPFTHTGRGVTAVAL